ncbi:unnamed protein product [Chrysoparadoxa australica]
MDGSSKALDFHKALLESGAILGFDTFGLCSMSHPLTAQPGSDLETCKRLMELHSCGYRQQIVIAPGVTQRIHLAEFGGYGYTYVLEYVVGQLKRLGASDEVIKGWVSTNLLSLLRWYTPPAPIELPKDFVDCSWCGTPFERIEGEYYHKHQFVYCGSKCLREHRKQGFTPMVE